MFKGFGDVGRLHLFMFRSLHSPNPQGQNRLLRYSHFLPSGWVLLMRCPTLGKFTDIPIPPKKVLKTIATGKTNNFVDGLGKFACGHHGKFSPNFEQDITRNLIVASQQRFVNRIQMTQHSWNDEVTKDHWDGVAVPFKRSEIVRAHLAQCYKDRPDSWLL